MKRLLIDMPFSKSGIRLAVTLYLVLIGSLAPAGQTRVVAAGYFQDDYNSRRAEKVMIDETYSVRETQLLLVSVPDADVVLERANGMTAHVVVTLSARDMDKALDYYERQRISSDYSDGAVRITSAMREKGFSFSWNSNSNGYANIVVTVAIPETFDLDISTSDGNVRAGVTRGTVSIRTSDGDISSEMLAGPSINVKTSDGNIKSGILTSPSLQIRTSDGDIMADEITAESGEIVTSDGSIELGKVDGSVSIRTSDGDIRVDGVRGPTVQIRTSDGDIRVGSLTVRSADVHTSDGDVRIEALDGELDAATSDGDIFVRFAKPSAANIRANDGDIVLVDAESIGANIELKAGRVRIDSDLTFRGTVEKRSASGTINGGGPLVRARTSDGTVYVRTSE